MGFDWLKTLATVAPTIATAIGGPLAGVAVNLATKALGIEPSENALAEAVASGDPGVLLKLRNADNTFKVEMRRLDIQEKELNVQDRSSARDLAIRKGLMPQAVISTIFILAFSAVLYAVFGGVAIDEEMRDTAIYLLGILSAGIAQIMNFWFGSSSGSKEKTVAGGK